MPSDSKIQRELEAGAQPHCEIRSKKPRNYRIIAAVVGVFLFAFGVTTGIALSQKLPISQALQAETIQNYLAKTFGSDFFDKFRGQQSSDSSSSSSATSESPASQKDDDESDKAATGATNRRLWQPGMGLKWNYQLSLPPTAAQLTNPTQFDVWGVDLFDTNATSIKTIQNAGSRVICYFSGGSFEPGRSDSNLFLDSDKGDALDGWPGEYWVKYNSANVRSIMQKRLTLAQSKGCDGVDPDNMDAYNNGNGGWGATQQDTIDYMTFLSGEAANRGLSIGLKNALEVVPSVVNMVQYSINEACSQYSECNTLLPFKNANKPVFNVEYPKGTTSNQAAVTGSKKTKSCADPTSGGISKIMKNRNLDTWIQAC